MTQFDNRMKVDLSGFIFLSVFFHWHIAIECRDQLLQHYPNNGGGGGNGGVSVDELWRRCNAFNRYNNPSEKASKQAITETIRSHWFHSFKANLPMTALGTTTQLYSE
ncbi:hypothetical protein BLOT_001660 [Blomia tropicalis]|nr:hypothetical protein BLOT_001660 [Blomia tropicalis]